LAPALPERRPRLPDGSDGAGSVKEKSRAHFARTKPERHRRSGSRVASVAEAKHCHLSTMTGRHERCVVLRTPATRGFFRCGFGRVQEPGDRRAGLTHSTASRYGPAGQRISVLRLAGHDQTPEQPECAVVGASVSTDADPRDRRRSEGSEWFQPGHSRGTAKADFVVKEYQGSESGVSALVLRLDAACSCKSGCEADDRDGLCR